MTICVSVKVSEGLVLAADSAATIQGSISNASGQPVSGILKTYEHMRKLSHLKDYPIGTLTWGTSLVGQRSVESLIKEYEYTLPSLTEEEEKIKELRMQKESVTPFKYDVKEIADGLLKHLKGFYDAEFGSLSNEEQPPLGVLVSGYSTKQFFPRQWLIMLPSSKQLQEVRPDTQEKPDFGANWFGLTDAIKRLHFGRDDDAVEIIASHFEVKNEVVHELLTQLQYPVVFNGMPLQDAIDYANYLVNVVIGRFRFVIGAPLCGGEIDTAVITPNAFTWVKRKSWSVS